MSVINLITGYCLDTNEIGEHSNKHCSTIDKATIDEETLKQILHQREVKFINSMYY